MSSVNFPSTGPKPKFNPNAEYKPVKVSPTHEKDKPKFNPNAGYEVAHVSPSAAQEPPSQFKPMTDWLALPKGGYTPLVPENAVYDNHTISTNQAAERVSKELENIDPHIGNVIYDYKKDMQGRAKSLQLGLNPKEGVRANFQSQQIERQLEQPTEVKPEEIAQYKEEMGSNVGMLRTAIDRKVKDLSKTEPEKANQLKADIYRLDAQDRADKDTKISKNVEKLKTGDLDYDTKRGVLVKPQGFFGSLATGFKQKNQLFKDYDLYTKTDNDAAIIKELNAKTKDYDPDEAMPVPDGTLGEMGAVLGGTPIKPLVGGAIANTFTTPIGGAAAAAAITSHEMYKLGYASALPKNYSELKRLHPDMPDFEAYTQAKKLAEQQAQVDASVGAAMGFAGMKAGVAATGVKSAFQKSVVSGLKQLGRAGVEKGLEGVAVGAMGAGGQVVKNIMAQKSGIPTDTSEGVKEQLEMGVILTMGMALATKFPTLLKPSTYNKVVNGLSKMPEEVLNQEFNNLQEVGYISTEELQAAQSAIRQQKTINSSIPENVPETERLKITAKIKERDILQGQLDKVDAAFHPELKERIKTLNEEIVNISKGNDRGELQKLVDKQVKDGKVEGIAVDAFKDATEKELNTYFKDIAEQASDPTTEQLTIETFGEEIVNKAKELYPAPAVKVLDKFKSDLESGKLERKEVQGSRNLGVYDYDGNIIKVVKSKRSYTPEQIEEIKGRLSDMDNVHYPKDIIDLGDGKSALLMDKAKGKDASILTQEEIDAIPQQHWDKFEADIRELSKKGIQTDLTKRSNFFYDPEKGFSFIDIDTPKEGPTNKFFTKDGREYYYDYERYPLLPKEYKSAKELFTNIKPKEDAVPQQITNEVDVREPSSNGETVGEGNTQPEIPTREEGQPIPEAESPSPNQEGQVSEPEMVGITHAEMDRVSRELGLPEYSKDPETFDQWTRAAKEKLAKDPNSINELINKLRKGGTPDPVETQMMKMHFAALKAKYDAAPTPELLNEINRTKDLYNISGRQEGKSLAARKGLMPVDENSLADFHLRDVEFNRGAPLTEEQTAQSTKEFNEIKSARDAFEQKVAQLEIENAKLKAEKIIQAEAKAAKKDAKKDYKGERQEILKNIGDKWKKSSKENLGASLVPYAKELAAIAPDVMKLVRNLIEEGVEKLPDVIAAVHKQLKDVIPQITEKDVHDVIAGEYTKKQTRNQLAQQLYDLRKEAKLMNELEQLLRGEIPQNEKRKIARNQRIEELRKQIKELKGEMGLNERSMEEKLASLKGRYKSKIKEVEDKIAKGDYGPDEKSTPIELDAEGKELRNKYLELKEERALRLLKQEYADRSFGQKALQETSKLVKTGRTLKSSFDVSYPFRQTIVGLSRQLFALPFTKNNGKWEFDAFRSQRNLREQFGKMYRAFGSERSFRATMDEIHNSPRYEIAQKAGLDFSDPVSNLDRAKEEMFQSSYAEKIPLVSRGVKASHRAATVIANKMKWDIFNELVDQFEQKGKTFENSKDLYEATAKYANQLVGRGILGEKLEMAAPVISHFVYSLRLYASRLQLLTYLVNPKFYTKVPKEIRVEYLKDMTKFMALGGTVMGLAAASGLGVGLNPFNSDFGSITVGNTKYDVWGGFKQYVVLLSRIMGMKANADKDLHPLFSEEPAGRNEKTLGDILLRFGRTKASPELGTIIDITTGKGFDNKPVTLKSAAADYFTPLLYKDVKSVYEDAGVSQALLTFLLAAHGVGTQTYTNDKEGGTTSSSGGKKEKKGKHTKQTKNTKN
jgi:hypothetical protein